MALSPQITNLIIMLGMMQGSKYVPFDRPEVLNAVRAVYILTNLIIFGLYYYMYNKISAKKDMKTIKYVEPPSMGSQEDPKLITTTNYAYDIGQLKTAAKGALMGIAIMAGMHLYMKYTNPLLIQSILPLKGLLEGNLAKLWLFGQKDEGDLKRPWKAAGNPLMQGLTGAGGADSQIKTDKASIEAAEKAGRGGAKEE